ATVLADGLHAEKPCVRNPAAFHFRASFPNAFLAPPMIATAAAHKVDRACGSAEMRAAQAEPAGTPVPLPLQTPGADRMGQMCGGFRHMPCAEVRVRVAPDVRSKQLQGEQPDRGIYVFPSGAMFPEFRRDLSRTLFHLQIALRPAGLLEFRALFLRAVW